QRSSRGRTYGYRDGVPPTIEILEPDLEVGLRHYAFFARVIQRSCQHGCRSHALLSAWAFPSLSHFRWNVRQLRPRVPWGYRGRFFSEAEQAATTRGPRRRSGRNCSPSGDDNGERI